MLLDSSFPDKLKLTLCRADPLNQALESAVEFGGPVQLMAMSRQSDGQALSVAHTVTSALHGPPSLHDRVADLARLSLIQYVRQADPSLAESESDAERLRSARDARRRCRDKCRAVQACASMWRVRVRCRAHGHTLVPS